MTDFYHKSAFQVTSSDKDRKKRDFYVRIPARFLTVLRENHCCQNQKCPDGDDRPLFNPRQAEFPSTEGKFVCGKEGPDFMLVRFLGVEVFQCSQCSQMVKQIPSVNHNQNELDRPTLEAILAERINEKG